MTAGKVEIILVAAVASNDVIGKDGTMPWHYKEDLKRFKEITTGENKALLMGRKTWESLPVNKDGVRLPGRKLLVMSKTDRFNEPGTVFIKKWSDDVLKHVHSLGITQLYVIGGNSLFNYFIPIADKAYITHIQKAYDGDTVFPTKRIRSYMVEVGREKLTDELTFVAYKSNGYANTDSVTSQIIL